MKITVVVEDVQIFMSLSFCASMYCDLLSQFLHTKERISIYNKLTIETDIGLIAVYD
jgi:hypothetical protein